jgi:hypothetical protein
MGRLAGFRYREIARKLKACGSSSIGKPLAAMKSGSAKAGIDTRQSLTTPATCRRELYAQS